MRNFIGMVVHVSAHNNLQSTNFQRDLELHTHGQASYIIQFKAQYVYIQWDVALNKEKHTKLNQIQNFVRPILEFFPMSMVFIRGSLQVKEIRHF